MAAGSESCGRIGDRVKQVTQNLSEGTIKISEVPVPALRDRFILVRNTASVISAGTEKTKVDMGKKNLLQKARARPDLVKQVLKKIRTEGLAKTFQTVSTRLNAPSPLGYSCAGEVLAVGGLASGIRPGDRVACGGADYANHAEFIAVPRNLVARIPDGVTNEEAAFTTIGAIALQGVRLAEPRLGETILVVGLGLLGQIATQLLLANGCNVIATDLDARLVERADDIGAQGIPPGASVEQHCEQVTHGNGVDSVIVCAGSTSNAIIEMCGTVVRRKGRVVVIGAVPMNIPREDFFKKEVSVVISCSYGPGRYDPAYEEQGNDYPFEYVRFTEQRNMEAFLDLVAKKRIDVAGLITHRFSIDLAANAYGLIEGKKKEPYLGIVLNYDSCRDASEDGLVRITAARPIGQTVQLSLYGAGNYATASLLPILRNESGVSFAGLLTASGRSAESVARQFGFSYCTSRYEDLLSDASAAIMITSRHDTHAEAVVRAIQSGKHVYVEKPLALTVEELTMVKKALTAHAGQHLMVGFNRRYAPVVQQVIDHFSPVQSPLNILIRVNAGSLPPGHWTQDPAQGGRIIGEGCHFVDLASALACSKITSVYASGASGRTKPVMLDDSVVISLAFANGSTAAIMYTSGGAPSLPKEYIEVHGGGFSATIVDFERLTLISGTGRPKIVNRSQDKGQQSMLKGWLASLKNGVPPADTPTLLNVSLATVLAIESMMVNEVLAVDSGLLDKQGD